MSLDTASKPLGKKLHCFLFHTKSILFNQGRRRGSTACLGRNTCACQVSTAPSHLQAGSSFLRGSGPETGFPFSCTDVGQVACGVFISPTDPWLCQLFLLSNKTLDSALRPSHSFYECLLKALFHVCTSKIIDRGQTSLYIHTLFAMKSLSPVSSFTFSLWG